ncbi:MAG: VWA domain-containing protein, partial [Bdellovibrionaceae bacterium]|nr:VWA domain-containing protein [Pseudobdellovibrionaceae bacterium]
MSWNNLWALLLFIPLIAVIVWNYLNRKKKVPSLQFSSLKVIKTLPPSARTRMMLLVPALKTAAIVLAILALARPQEANTKVKKNVEGIDIVICLDISDSMLIEDMKPSNRLEAAKETIRQFIEKRSSDRIGLVVFAGESFTLVPLTLDYQLILERVKEITTAASANIKDGTAIGVALANAAGRLKDSTAKSRIMIF